MQKRRKRRKSRGDSRQAVWILASVFLAITVVVAATVLLLRNKEDKTPSNGEQQEQDYTQNQTPPTSSAEGQATQNQQETGEDSQEDSVQTGDEDSQPDEEGKEEEQDEGPVSFNKPDKMKGAVVAPGIDFLTQPQQEEASQQAEIDGLVQQVKDLGFNTLLVDLVTKEGSAFSISTMRSISTFDGAEYLLAKAREEGLFVYGIYNLLYSPHNDEIQLSEVKNTEQANIVNSVLEEVAKQYQFDGILLDGCENPSSEDTFADYVCYGAGRSYEEYMRDNAAMMVASARETVAKYARNTQVGLLTGAVWATKEQNEAGLESTAEYTVLGDGHLDSRELIRQGAVDFAAIENYGSTADTAAPFAAVAQWWNTQAEEAPVPVYMLHAADRACTAEYPGWASHDQLTRQVISMEECSSLQGSIFNSLASLRQNPKNSTTLLQDYYSNNVKAEHILKELTFTKPTQLKISTTDKTHTFQGASDPNSAVTMDGKAVATDENGFFSVTVELAPGENKYTFVHKEKTMTFTINRQVQVIREVTPEGSLSVDGGMKVTITAVAYENSSVYATINGQNIPMAVDETADNEDLRGTSYIRYTGTFTAPKGQAKAQKLGNISITATWEGVTKTMEGASVTVNKLAVVADGRLVRVTAEQAITFPVNEIGKYPEPNCYRLPQGTLDYAVGDEVVYKDEEGVRKYYKLASGLRVYSSDIAAVSDDTMVVAGNIISGVTVKADKQFTYVILKSEYPVPFKPKYSSTKFEIEFQYTTGVPEDLSLSKNPLFSSATWSDTTLSLGFISQNGFLGYKAYHDDGAIVFRFNNPTSISGARIAIDPGHGGGDNGAPGFNPNYQEKHINWAMAKSLANALEERGANVLLLKTLNQTTSMDSRLQQARDFNAVVFVSVHHNSARSSATGTEAYYFYPFAQSLASRITSATSDALNTNNRGARYGVFYVTRDPQFVGVLSEGGFLTNNKEYNKLIDEDYQEEVGEKMAAAIAAFLKNAGSGNAGATGIQSTGDAVTDVTEPPSTTPPSSNSEEQEDQGKKVTKITLKDEKLTIAEGEVAQIHFKLSPEEAGEDQLEWSSSDNSVVKVNASGKVRGEATGTAVITVSAGEVQAKCTVTVTGEEQKNQAAEPEEIQITNAPQTMTVGQRVQLKAEVVPSGGASEIEWEISASSQKLARINGNGMLEALSPGTVSVRAKVAGSNCAHICKIEITQ